MIIHVNIHQRISMYTFDFIRFGAFVGQRHGHFPMSNGVDRVRSKGELCFENGLTLQTGSLPHEKMVKVTRDRVLVNVENFLTEMERHGSVRPPKRDIGFFFGG